MNKKNKGFTLIEIIIAVAILAILIGIAVPMILGHVNKTKRVVCESNIQTLRDTFMLRIAELDGSGENSTWNQIFKDVITGEGFNGKEESANTYSGLCPSGGRYTIAADESKARLTISCDIHGSETSSIPESVTGPMGILENYIKQLSEDRKNGLNAYTDGRTMIEELYNKNNGSLQAVEKSLVEQAFGSASDKIQDLYWRANIISKNPDYTGVSQNYILYASPDNSTSHQGWGGYLAYYNGQLYKSTKKNQWNGNPATSSVSNNGSESLFSSDEAVDQWLKDQGFEPVS